MPRPRAANASPTAPPPDPTPTPAPAPTPPKHPLFREPDPVEDSPAGMTDPGPISSSLSGNDGAANGRGSASGTRSTTPTTKAVTRGQLVKVAGAVVGALGAFVHSVMTAPESLEREQGLWLPDEDDLDTIAGPLAGIAYRRTPEGVAGKDTPDLIGVVVGVVMYATKNLIRGRELRGARELYQSANPLSGPGGPDDPDAYPPPPVDEPHLPDAVRGNQLADAAEPEGVAHSRWAPA